jgi:Concanavalin A-like lectin/glucanases superfamily
VQGTLSRYATPVQFGRYVNVDVYLPGTLDDLRIYGRALSAEEIRGLAQGDQ